MCSYMASCASANLSVLGAAGEKNRPADVYCVWFRYDHLVTFLHWPSATSDNKGFEKSCNCLGDPGGPAWKGERGTL